MKNTLYIIRTLVTLSLLATSCGPKENQNKKEGHPHNEEVNKEPKKEHSDRDEVMLSAQQFEALKIKIDTIASRNMSSYVEANGTLEVPPQSEGAITSVIGANVASIEVIEVTEVIEATEVIEVIEQD